MITVELNGFTYREQIKESELSIESPLFINEKIPEMILLRLLIGTLHLKRTTNSTFLAQPKNYSSLPFKVNKTKRTAALKTSIENIDLISYSDTVKKYLRFNLRNISFFEEILCDISWSYTSTSPVQSFIHLYRTIEQISYPLPLLYAKHSNDYRNSYATFKKQFENKGESDGELAFFKTFLREFYKSTSVISTTIDIDFSILSDDEYKYLKKFHDSFKSKDFVYDDKIVKIKFLDFHSYILTVRNRFVHNNTGEATNYSNKYLDPEKYFMPIIEPARNWIGFILIDIFRNSFAEYEANYAKTTT